MDGYGRPLTYQVAVFHASIGSVSPLERYCRAGLSNTLKHVRNQSQDAAGGEEIVVAITSHGPHGCSCHEGTLDISEGANNPEEGGQKEHQTLWATRHALLAVYGTGSCAPFHQPLPPWGALYGVSCEVLDDEGYIMRVER